GLAFRAWRRRRARLRAVPRAGRYGILRDGRRAARLFPQLYEPHSRARGARGLRGFHGRPPRGGAGRAEPRHVVAAAAFTARPDAGDDAKTLAPRQSPQWIILAFLACRSRHRIPIE